MSIFEKLTADNFQLFAAKYYHNMQCNSVDEFYEDLNRIKYIKKLINRFLKDGKDDEQHIFRMLMNHVIVFYNVFEIDAANRMILFKLTETQLPVLKVILLHLGYIKNNDWISIPLNKNAINQYREKKDV